jgi:glycosyltransferase involved in cell wall biosynthesis
MLRSQLSISLPKLPKISCLLVTANGRFELVKRSIQCFLDQTYPNKELVIVNEGPKAYQEQIQEYVKNYNNIICQWLDGKYKLGSLRNISIGLCDGELFCQWDDDDYCTPQRLALQYSYFYRSPKTVACYLGDQLHYYFDNSELYWDNWSDYGNRGILNERVIPGTLMCKRIDVKYSADRAGEDSVFLNRLINKSYEVCLIKNQGFMHVYTCHGMNQVYGLDHHLAISKLRSQNMEFILKNRKNITNTLNYLKLNDSINVMSREGLAFRWSLLKTHK